MLANVIPPSPQPQLQTQTGQVPSSRSVVSRTGREIVVEPRHGASPLLVAQGAVHDVVLVLGDVGVQKMVVIERLGHGVERWSVPIGRA